MEANARRLKDLEETLARLNHKTADLRKKRAEAKERLYQSMLKNNVEKCEGYTIKKIQPKIRVKRKPAKAKKTDAIKLFADIGIEDPDSFYAEFEKTQKIVMEEENEEN